MKKKSKIISILSVSFLLTGCSCSVLSRNRSGKDTSAHVHQYSEKWSIDNKYHYHKCMVEGCKSVSNKEEHQMDDVYYYKCNVCGYMSQGGGEYVATKDGHFMIINGQKGPLEEHILEDYEGDKKHVPLEPTCDKAGKALKQCVICKRIVDEIIPALGHDLVETGYHEATATCEKGGCSEFKCSRCDYSETRETQPLGHIYKSQSTSDSSITKETCERSNCLYEAYVFDCTKTDSGWNALVGTDAPYKMGSRTIEENGTWSFPFGLIPNGNYAIEIECKMTSNYYSHRDRYFFNHAHYFQDDPAQSASEQDQLTEAVYRYQFSFNGSSTYINPDNLKTYSENGMSVDEYKYVRVVSTCNISNLTVLTLHHGKIGYPLYIRNVKLVRISID